MSQAIHLRHLTLALYLFLVPYVGAQVTLDSTFNVLDDGFHGDNTRFNNAISAIRYQPNGKMVVGGKFDKYYGYDYGRILRLHQNGELDTSFHVGIGFNNEVTDIALLPNGKMIVVGNFTSYNGQSVNRIARLNTDGSIDPTFISGSGFQNKALTVDVSSSGRIVVGGIFGSYNGVNSANIAVLNSDGSYFSGFVPTAAYTSAGFQKVKFIGGDSILVSGYFTNYNASGRQFFIRFTNTGVHDLSFDFGMPNGFPTSSIGVTDFEIDSLNGHIYVAGARVMRCYFDGSQDNSFYQYPYGPFYELEISDNALFLSGGAASGIQKRTLDGYVDNNFSAPISSYFQHDGDSTLHIPGNGSLSISAYSEGGTYIPESFMSFTGSNSSIIEAKGNPDGKIYIRSNGYNGVTTGGLCRLLQNGELDPTFNMPTSISVADFVLLPNAKLIISSWEWSQGTSTGTMKRINADGTLDPTFNLVNTSFESSLRNLVVQPDGKILYAIWDNINNIRSINRINPDGSEDLSFTSITYGSDFFIEDIELRSDGKIFVALSSNSFGNQQVRLIYAYEANGVEDNSLFTNVLSSDGKKVYDIYFDEADTMFVLGQIKLVNGISIGFPNENRLLKFLPMTDSLDPAFSTSFYAYVSTATLSDFRLLPEPNGIMHVIGNSLENGVYSNHWTKRMPDGNWDPNFIPLLNNIGNLTEAKVEGGFLDGIGNTILFGDFSYHTGFKKNNICRVLGASSMDPCLYFQGAFTNISEISCSNPIGSMEAQGYYGMAPYNYVWDNGLGTQQSIVSDTTGIFICTVSDANSCTDEISILFSGPSSQSQFDVEANFITGEYRPGFTTNSFISINNNGCQPVNPIVKLVLDPDVQYVSSNPAASQVIADTVIWNLSAVTFDSLFTGAGEIQLTTITSTSAQIGDTMDILLEANPYAGDLNPSNNLQSLMFPIVNAYDPNDKKSYPQGKCAPHFVKSNESIKYTVRFQNTGNSEAINVRVLDIIPAELDRSSLRVVASSHPMTTLLEGDSVSFYFDNIYLPDSSAGQFESQGYVVFSIDLLDTNLNDIPILNGAEIYFDFNPPIYTNIVSLTGYDAVAMGEDLSTYICDIDPCANFYGAATGVTEISCLNQIGDISVQGFDGLVPYTYTWQNGLGNQQSLSPSTSGFYTCQISDANNCTDDVTVLVNQPTSQSNFDLDVSLVTEEYRAGIQTKSFINIQNKGCQPASPTIQVMLDPAIQFVSANPAPNQVVGNTLTWYLAPLTCNVLYTNFNEIEITTMADAAVQIGDSLTISVRSTPYVGDIDTNNNRQVYVLPVSSSNSSQNLRSYPQGKCAANYVNSNKSIKYIARFQNTGLSDAINVRVLDIIPPELDPSSVRVIAASHPVITSLEGDSITYFFENINLPDSSAGQFVSQGYVIFTVDLLDTNLNDVPFLNNAEVYFDSNPLVYTNTVLLTGYDSAAMGADLSAYVCDSDPCINFQGTFTNVTEISCLNPTGTLNVEAAGGLIPYSFAWENGFGNQQTISPTSGGFYTCHVSDANNCTVDITVLVNEPNSLTNHDIDVSVITEEFRAGEVTKSFINIQNKGCQPVDPFVKFVLDPAQEFVSSIPDVNLVWGDTLIWLLSSLSYDASYSNFAEIELTTLTDAASQLGDTLNFSVQVTPYTGDIDTSNNVQVFAYPLVDNITYYNTSSYPQGKCVPKYVNSNESIKYAIRFQNTGTSEVTNIRVLDILPAELDPSTLRVVAASHSVTTHLSGDSITFHFDNINLPDSSFGQFMSQGYIVFNIDLFDPNLHEVPFLNSTEIYFDNNSPLYSNITPLTGYDSGVTGVALSALECGLSGVQEVNIDGEASVLVYPNPTTGKVIIELSNAQSGELTVLDMQGKVILSQLFTDRKQLVLELENSDSGIYLIRLVTDYGMSATRLLLHK